METAGIWLSMRNFASTAAILGTPTEKAEDFFQTAKTAISAISSVAVVNERAARAVRPKAASVGLGNAMRKLRQGR